MREIIGDFWNEFRNYEAIVVTTNGIVKRNGDLVMGAGIAKQFKERYPRLPGYLGDKVVAHGNLPFIIKYSLDTKEPRIISFPTKDHFKDKSKFPLIQRGAALIATYVKVMGINSVLATKPGCGLGGLRWTDVKPILERSGWDDRFTIVSPR